MKKLRVVVILFTLLLSLGLLAVSLAVASSGGGNLIADPSFEAGSPNPYWNEYSTNFGTPLCDPNLCNTAGGQGPNSGNWWAWFGGISAYEEGAVSQTVTIPPGTATFTFYYEVHACDTAADYMELTIDGNQLFYVDGGSPLCDVIAYTQEVLDVSAYADGAPHDIEFHSEVFGQGGAISNFFVDDVSLGVVGGVVVTPSIALTKTVGTDPTVCATTDNITVPAGGGGTDVYYCYEVMNTGNITFTMHDFVDSELGAISGIPYTLIPGASVNTVAAGLTVSATITETTTNVATWTASISTTQIMTYAMATDSATVTRGDPTGVSLSAFDGESPTTLSPLLLVGLLVLVLGFGLALYRKQVV